MALISFTGSPHGGSHKLLPEWNRQPRITEPGDLVLRSRHSSLRILSANESLIRPAAGDVHASAETIPAQPAITLIDEFRPWRGALTGLDKPRACRAGSAPTRGDDHGERERREF